MKQQKLGSIAFLGATLISLASCGKLNHENSKLSETSEYKTVCLADDIPRGWVIIARELTISCPGSSAFFSTWNSHKIIQPGSRETVCENSPVPNGYHKVELAEYGPCQTPPGRSLDYKNAFVIERD